MLFRVLNVDVSPLALGIFSKNQGADIPTLIHKHQRGHWGYVDQDTAQRNACAIDVGVGCATSIYYYNSVRIELQSDTHSGFSLSTQIKVLGERWS
ncbi:MAG: hypothetical protein GY938_11015 [Ketobacter sp.]|nr:hypothetical protein [Ketobacter sp.]